MMQRAAVKGVLAALAIVCGPASAQWIQLPLPGTPRTKDGKADLAAATPRTADGKTDYSGIWKYTPPRRNPAGAAVNQPPAQAGEAAVSLNPPGSGGGGIKGILQAGDSIEMEPWAADLYKKRVESNGVGLPSEHCLPHGPPGALMIPIPFKLMQTPRELAILFEEFNYYRQIHLDGRGHPAMLTPTWFGYSVGKWDKDVLVVDTVGYNEQTWLDISGYPHSEGLHTTERYTRRDFGHLEVKMTIDDAKAYKKPWSVVLAFELQPDTELMEHVCENERDARHMVGK